MQIPQRVRTRATVINFSVSRYNEAKYKMRQRESSSQATFASDFTAIAQRMTETSSVLECLRTILQ